MSKPGPKRISPDDVRVGQITRTRRLAMGMDRRELGASLGVSFQQIQKYEKGVNRVSAGRLRRLAEVLGVPITFFYDLPGPSGGGKVRTADPVVDAMLATKEGIAMLRAMARIESSDLRRAFVRIVEAAFAAQARAKRKEARREAAARVAA